MFRDSRAAGGDIIVDLWLAPIQIPDDRINVLGIGIKVNLFSGYDVDDEIMSCIVKKALAASEELNKLLDFAISDLRSPFIQNHRTGIYRKALMLEHVALAEPQFIAQISEVVNDFGHGRIDYDQAVSMCELILVAKGENWPEDLMAIPVSQKARLLTEISIARKLAS
jgi:hypothetical protein